MSVARTGGKAYYQRYFTAGPDREVQIFMKGWVWWQLISVTLAVENTGADDKVFLYTENMNQDQQVVAGGNLIIGAGNDNPMSFAINLPPSGVPAQGVIISNVAENGVPITAPLADVEMEQDGIIEVTSLNGDLTFSSVSVTVRGHRVGDP
jgi:hypothetical protein